MLATSVVKLLQLPALVSVSVPRKPPKGLDTNGAPLLSKTAW